MLEKRQSASYYYYYAVSWKTRGKWETVKRQEIMMVMTAFCTEHIAEYAILTPKYAKVYCI
jgi:hypothetical protein